MYDEERSDTLNISDVEEWKLYKYRPLLRFFNFLLFREYTKKLQRLRKADRLLEVEAEIREKENLRQQNLRELELRMNAMLGRPGSSPFNNNPKEKIGLNARLDLCESKMKEMQLTLEKIHILVREVAATMGGNVTQETLPPTPPGRKSSFSSNYRRHHFLRNQHVSEESDVDE
ncbi:unnamed protein product [Cylicostephanus goldi]|uniref:Uncharacterized protein n=1 Tax=Cylicostephanus goldi TaxID=71465 RepID=A0A3P7PSP1_CYLGO|nr:unnamed protein product [Cylicostephanus goldi]